MSILKDLLDSTFFSGVPSNAVWDLMKFGWSKITEKSWEDFYLESFQQALNDTRPLLSKYAASDGEIGISEDALQKALRRDLLIDPSSISYSTTNNEQFASRLAVAMVKGSVLTIGGHNLSQDDYIQIIHNLVKRARANFKTAVLNNEEMFRRAMLDESQVVKVQLGDVQSALSDIQQWLVNQFGITIPLLREIHDGINEVKDDIKDIKRALTDKPLLRQTKTQRLAVMISSTVRDLPEHRKEVMSACMDQGVFPLMMENLPANDNEAISASLKMVDKSDIYVGIFAYRYGYIPRGHDISVTEMEYNRAVERNIPRLIFIIDKEHQVKFEDIDMENASKLNKFKDQVQTSNVVNFFKSSADLRYRVLHSLSQYIESSHTILSDQESTVVNITAYFNALRKRYNVLALEGLTPPQKEENLKIQLRSVFVEQSVREDTPPVELPKEVWEKLSREQEIHSEDLPSGITLDDVRKARDSYYQKPSQLVLDALTDTRNKYSIILGDPGSGKSTLSRYVMLSLIDPLLADDKIQKAFEGYLPLLIELRTFAGLSDEGKCETPLEFLEHLGKTEGWSLTQSTLHNYLKDDGRAMVIFDGLDEIFDPKLRETITNQIVGFTNTYPKARVIVTSRILGYRRKILSDAGFNHFTLQDLDEKQVIAFITNWYELAMSERPEEATERSERILKSFADQASIRQLAGNPMLLTIMAIIGKHQELPRERWKLYDHAASVLIQHWDVNKHLKDERIEADFIGEDDKKELLRRLAFRMQSGDGGLAGNYIHREDLQEEFENYLKERYNKAPDQAKVIAEAMIQQFRERNFILSLYGANVFGFVHRAFLEYFCASAFTWKFEKTKELAIDQLKTDVYEKHWEDQSWHEVLQLICGMIDEKWVEEIVDYLVNSIYRPWPDVFGKKLPWNIVLAVQCLGEIRNQKITASTTENILHTVLDIIGHFLDEGREFATSFQWIIEQTLSYLERSETNLISPPFFINWFCDRSEFKYGIIQYKEIARLINTMGKGHPDIQSKLVKITTNTDEGSRAAALFALAVCFTYEAQTLSLLHEHVIKDENSQLKSIAILVLAENYREDAATLPLLRQRAVQDENANARIAAVSALAEHYHEDAEILQLLRGRVAEDKNWNVRSTAVSALAKHYREDAQTLPLLQEWVVKSEHSDVRSAAVSALAEYYFEDTQTLPLLREHAIQDGDANVRSAAVSALAEYYFEDTQTLPLLREHAIQDGDANVRKTALSALVEHYREDSQTLPLLREHAIQDGDANVRKTALSALAEHYREDTQTLPLLREHAIQDSDANVRKTAWSALAEHYREDTQTLPLLREHAIQDGDANVRKTALSALAEHYREDAQTLPLLRERVTNDNYTPSQSWELSVRQFAFNLLLDHYQEDLQTLPLLQEWVVKSEHSDVRSAAVSALANHYREDAETLPLLRERAVQDADPNVRSAAVSALAEHYHEDAQTLPLLLDRALKDDDSNVRSAAVSALTKHYHEDAQTLPLLRKRAVQDENSDVRRSTVSALAEYYREDAETLPLLRERAVQDENSDVRRSAMSALAKHYREDAQTLPLLRECAIKDESPKSDDEKKTWQNYVRETAIEAIAKHWSDHPDTLPLLREREENDPTPWLRERCNELIKKIEGSKDSQ